MCCTKNIILTGFMGTGKSSVGNIIARTLNCKFVDTDKVIEQEQGRTIANIFDKSGETRFRELEHELIKDICDTDSTVIATGGGTLLFEKNLSLMTSNGILFCLDAKIDILLKRLKNKLSRPLIAYKETDEILQLYLKRKDSYKNIPNHIDTSEISKHKTAELIIKSYYAQIDKLEQ